MSKLAKAIKLSAEIHDHQFDKGGEPYILHPLAVMHLVRTSSRFERPEDKENLLITSVLHDVLEDVKVKDWVEEGIQLREYILRVFGEEVLFALNCLTKKDGETYADYIERVATNWIARRVKIADLTHNLDPSRLPVGNICEVDLKRWDKYHRALVRLERGD